MSKKKSYMNRKNILNEGFFEKVLKFLKIKPTPEIKKKIKSRDMLDKVFKFNKSAEKLEKALSNLLDKKVTLDGAKLSYFEESKDGDR